MLLNNIRNMRSLIMRPLGQILMRHLILGASFVVLMAAPSQAACYADYQAKTDNPLRLHYGVIALSDAACADMESVETEASTRLEQGGWTLLRILSRFGSEGLKSRRADAGQNYLRF